MLPTYQEAANIEEVLRRFEPGRVYAEKEVDYSGLSDEELLAKLDEMTEHMRYMWWIHGHINFVLLSSSAFCDLYAEVMQPDGKEAVHTLPFPARRTEEERRRLLRLLCHP